MGQVKPKFDPSKPFEVVSTEKPKFDPNAPFEAVEQESSWMDKQLPFETTPRGLIKGGLDALPAAGGIIGGIAGGVGGAVTGPGALVTGAGGAMLGQAAGESYKQLAENYLFDKKRQPLDAAQDIGLAGAEGAASQLAGNAVGMGAKAAAGTKLGKGLISGTGSVLAKVGEAATGIPKKAIETYAKYAPELSKMSKAAGGDIQEVADAIRKKWSSGVDAARKALNDQLGTGLKNNAGKAIDAQPILDSLATVQNEINPAYYPEATAYIDDMIRKISSQAKDGKLGVEAAHEAKQYLQDMAKAAYKDGGEIFVGASKPARAAKGAASVARRNISKEVPEIAKANSGLSNLHSIEDTMAKNLLKEGETTASIMGAGSGANTKNIKTLKRLGKATGQDMVSDAEKVFALKTFKDAPLLPLEATGKAAARMGAGAAAGGYATGDKEGAMAGMMLTSPLALKTIIRSGRGIMKGGDLILNTPGGRQVIGHGLLKKMGLLPSGLMEEENN